MVRKRERDKARVREVGEGVEKRGNEREKKGEREEEYRENA